MQRAYEIQLMRTKVAEPSESLTSPQLIARYCQNLSRLDREHFVRLDFNCQLQVISRETVHICTVDQVLISPRDVFRGALLMGASRIALVHNHPSGDPEASEEDTQAIERLQEAGRLLEIELVDFLIIGDDGWYWSSVDSKTHIVPKSPPCQMSLESYNRPIS